MMTRENMHEESSIRMKIVKLMALLKVRFPASIASKEEQIIEQYPNLSNHYRACIEQIERMKSRKFIDSCTLYDLLVKCHSKFAELFRNLAFERNFKLYDLSEFSTYAKDMVRAFESAQKLYHSMVEQEEVINEAVYDTLSHIIVRGRPLYS
ncbi:hypothetical protein TSAR_008327 [Trichomalopsis sarcophagae]|uniref:Uncharacterized protein n=1 Tax=Trichomalopsis sarcophagae TaxID=543379 RepID=A0A232ELL0_9HYME|nr:hypothetical protein TSAR_008327 [Trichomalopsis sarcophagae]